MARIIPALLALLITALPPSAGLAWFDQGHMMVAAIAWKRLTPDARLKAAALLNLNPDYGTWLKTVPPGASAELRDEILFMKAATWPDAIKIDPRYRNDGEKPSGPDSARNIGYADTLQHRYWHYDDRPFSPDGTPVGEPQSPNAQTEIELFEATIADETASEDVRSYDLVWLLHLVGDVHQPLHAISRFTAEIPGGDRGGNLVQLCVHPCKDELHLFWDGVVGDDESPSAALAAADALADAPPDIASVSDDKAWLEESFELAKSSVYVEPIGPGAGPYAVTPEYRGAALQIADQRISAAGARLGNLLNAILK